MGYFAYGASSSGSNPDADHTWLAWCNGSTLTVACFAMFSVGFSMTVLWSREDLAWLAGLLEGEGCFTVRKPQDRKIKRTYICVLLSMTDKDVVDHAQQIGGCGTRTTQDRSVKGWQLVYCWKVQNQDHAYALMIAVYPWLGSRRQARIRELIQDHYLRT